MLSWALLLHLFLLLWASNAFVVQPTVKAKTKSVTNALFASCHDEQENIDDVRGLVDVTTITSATDDAADSKRTSLSKNNNTGRRSFLGSTTATAVLAMDGSVSPPRAMAATTSSLSSPSQQKSSPRVVLWGFGNQNKLMARYLYEKKTPVVGVVSHHNIGKDYGMLDYDPWESIHKKTGVMIVDEASAGDMMDKVQPNVCIMCTKSTLSDIYPSLEVCAQQKVNVITIAEELLFSAGSSKQLTKELDTLFKKNGVSVTGSGFIDGACCAMALALSGSMHRINGMEGTLQYNADLNGPVLATAHGIGLTPQEFKQQIVLNTDQEKSYVYNSNEWFASALGLQVVNTKEDRQPILAPTTVYSKAQDKTIPMGDVIGMKVVATTKTKENVTIRAEQVGSVYTKDSDKDYTSWTFLGEPAGVSFSIDDPPTTEMTNTATMARIDQILKAEAGYVTTDKFDITRYQHWST
mmetsp:Transcript_15091/g.32953  ORF Transcript_15091/g.32953 Transcript_15091/m.32953 type:complete len:466 (-) Transcript_15091:160-1557(-)